MKRIKQFLMGTVLAAAGFAAMPFTSYAQKSDRPSAMRWKGADVTTLNEEFLLYNVGTGKFMTAGGGWGVQGMLLYQDFGTMMDLVSNGNGTYVIKSNVENGDFENAKYSIFLPFHQFIRCYGIFPYSTIISTNGNQKRCFIIRMWNCSLSFFFYTNNNYNKYSLFNSKIW